MPKKIKKEKETILKGNKESIINIDNIHIFFMILVVAIVCVCTAVGIYVYKEDKYHAHKDNAIVTFEYTEALDEGYDVYSVTETDTKQIFTEHNSLAVQDVKEMSRKKYLDFNEEVYATGIADYMTETQAEQPDEKWSLYLKFADGTKKYLYSRSIDESTINKEALDQIIQKYFGEEIRYK